MIAKALVPLFAAALLGACASTPASHADRGVRLKDGSYYFPARDGLGDYYHGARRQSPQRVYLHGYGAGPFWPGRCAWSWWHCSSWHGGLAWSLGGFHYHGEYGTGWNQTGQAGTGWPPRPDEGEPQEPGAGPEAGEPGLSGPGTPGFFVAWPGHGQGAEPVRPRARVREGRRGWRGGEASEARFAPGEDMEAPGRIRATDRAGRMRSAEGMRGQDHPAPRQWSGPAPARAEPDANIRFRESDHD